MSTRLSKYFTLEELTVSERAKQAGVSNKPLGRDLQNVQLLATFLDSVREILGAPMIISSGFRSTAVNKLVGGSDTSAHSFGLAADFTSPKFGTPLEICRKLASSALVFDQLIYERKKGKIWVHIGLPTGGKAPRRELLTATDSGYLRGIVA